MLLHTHVMPIYGMAEKFCPCAEVKNKLLTRVTLVCDVPTVIDSQRHVDSTDHL